MFGLNRQNWTGDGQFSVLVAAYCMKVRGEENIVSVLLGRPYWRVLGPFRMPCRLVTLSVIRPLRLKLKLVDRQAFFYPADLFFLFFFPLFSTDGRRVLSLERYNNLKEEMAG